MMQKLSRIELVTVFHGEARRAPANQRDRIVSHGVQRISRGRQGHVAEKAPQNQQVFRVFGQVRLMTRASYSQKAESLSTLSGSDVMSHRP